MPSTTYAGHTAIFQIMAGATAGNLGGGGFNPKNANFPTDGVIAGGTGNAATVTPTSSYSPVLGDVGAWAFFPVQTGVTHPSWFPITASGGGVMTLNTSVGAGVQIINNRFVTNTIAGCASTATPTLTYGIDYSQQNSAQFTASTATTVVSGTTFTDSTYTPGNNWIGNFVCISSTSGTAGWYECVSNSSGTITLDRSAGASTSVTYYMGGAISLNGSTTGITDSIFWYLGSTATNVYSAPRFFIQKGSYTLSANFYTLPGTFAWPTIVEGYNLIRGDRPSISSGNQPTMNGQFIIGDYSECWCITVKGISSTNVGILYAGNSAGNVLLANCKGINTSTSHATGSGIWALSNCRIIGCEGASYRGAALNLSNSFSCWIIGGYYHDSNIGITTSGYNNVILDNIIANNVTSGWNDTGGQNLVYGNTIYGSEARLGNGITMSLSGTNGGAIMNNILYGLSIGLSGPTSIYSGNNNYNCYYNNGTNISGNGSFLEPNDLTTAPAFTNISQVTGTAGATSSPFTTLTDSSKNFTTAGVVAGRDYLYVSAGSGVTAQAHSILSVGTTTLVVDTAMTNGTASNLTYSISIGRNWTPGTALSATGFPTTFSGLTGNSQYVGAVTPTPTAPSSFTFSS